jgi:transcription termination/antitermination protein NusA
MNKDILLVVEALSNEKGVDKSVIFEAIELALAAAAAKRYKEDVLVRVAIDHETCNYESFRCWTVVEDTEEILELPDQQMMLSKAKEIDADLKVGDAIEEPIENSEFGRIGAQQAKQVIIQKVREAERKKIIKQYQHRLGDLVIGIVKRVTRDNIILDMGGNAEALLSRDNMISREAFRVNDRLRAYLFDVSDEPRGPQLFVSRTDPKFLIELFKIEVPEIGEEVIEVKGAARDPGSRAKIAVKTNDGRIDPIGACVGMRGSRVQTVSNELAGERIDIILWDDNPAQLVINAMAPAEVASIVVDEDTHAMDIAVTEDQLSQAIGRSGQNVRLASELTGWTLNVMSEGQAVEKQEIEASSIKDLFVEKLGVDEDIADVLENEGFSSVEEVAYVPVEEMAAIEGFDEEIVEELQRRASDCLLMQEIGGQESTSVSDSSNNLRAVDGMTEELVEQFVEKGIATSNDLADCAVDELQELINIDADLAAKLIMAAREYSNSLLSLDGMTEALAKQLVDKGVTSRDDLAEYAVDELQEIIEIDAESASKLIMKAREHWFDDTNA